MENSDENKTDVNTAAPAEPPKPSKPTLIDKLKGIRWTFKVKNNLTQFITVEPLICFYMFQIFVLSLIEPYHFHKACLSLVKDTYFCDVITINQDESQQPCARFEYREIFCKGFSEENATIDCEEIIRKYDDKKTEVFVKPEDYRFCHVVVNTTSKAYTTFSDSLVGISEIILTFLVVMVISIWSDKYSKRKICLILPILGQLIISIINLHGALSTYLSFEFINTATIFIVSLSGGMPLFLFGCFSYMTNETIRHKLLFRFGIISLVLTIYRYIPILYYTVYQYYHDDDSYISLISLNLVFNILCLLYVKVILNESKENVINGLDNGSESVSISSELQSVSNGKKSKARKSKRKQLAKAFSLDVMWDYILIVFKKRIQTGRLIIILFLAIVLVGKISPYDERFTLTIQQIQLDIIDIDGAVYLAFGSDIHTLHLSKKHLLKLVAPKNTSIFVIISIMMLLFRISDVAIAILVIGIPTAARLFLVLLESHFFQIDVDSSATDFYTPFKRIASCSLLLAYVDKNETRIFLIVQAIASLPKVVFQFLTSKDNGSIVDVVQLLYDYEYYQLVRILIPVISFVLPVLVFCGLGLLYKIVKNYGKYKTEQMRPKTTTAEDITKNPWSFIKPANFEVKNETDKDQLSPVVFKENEYSTDL